MRSILATSKIGSNRIVSRWSAERISILLTIIALALWSYSVTQAEFTIGHYGLIHSFPVTYFVSLGILTVASAILWVSKRNHSKLLFLQLSLLIVSLWLVPLLLGGSQPAAEHIREKFFSYGYVPLLSQGGHLDPATYWYHSWPGLFILMTSVVNILGIPDLEPAFILAPFLLQLAFALVLYPLLKSLLGPDKSNYCWAGVWIFMLANWGEQNYLGPQAFGLLLLLFILFLFIKISRQAPGGGAAGYRLSIIILFAALLMTHFLTFLVGLAMATGLTILYRRRISFNLVIITAVLGAVWTFYQTNAMFEHYLPQYIERAFSIDIILGDIFGAAGETGGIVGSASHQAVALIRIITSAIFVFIVFIGLLMGRWSRKYISADNAFIVIGAGALLAGVSGLYSQEIVQRTWYFMLPVVAYFGLKLVNRRATATVLCLVLLAALPLHFISHYGNQASDYRSPSHIAGFTFTDSTVENAPRAEALLRQLSLEGDILLFSQGGICGPFPSGDHYFAISQRMDAYYDFQRNQPEFVDIVWAWAQTSGFYDSIYANPEYNLYIHYGGRPPEGINIAQPDSLP